MLEEARRELAQPSPMPEWLRYADHDRTRKPSTLAGYRAIVQSQLLPAFGEVSIESITPAMVEA